MEIFELNFYQKQKATKSDAKELKKWANIKQLIVLSTESLASLGDNYFKNGYVEKKVFYRSVCFCHTLGGL